jgi:UDP-N-acetylmuramoyl-L-alanyl-D-glutamate--2,6-diaminopimelate ligase
LTTPTSAELSQVFSQMLEHGCTAAVIEASSHAIHQRRVAAIDFDVAAFTNLTQDHLDYHGTMDEYASAKAELFSWLKPSALAVVNAEDPAHQRMLAECGSRTLLAYPSGRSDIGEGEATIFAKADGRLGTSIRAVGPWGEIEGRVGLIGPFNGANLLLAIAIAHEMGLDARAIETALPELTAPAGRLEVVSGADDPYSVIVDFAYTPDALRSAIQVPVMHTAVTPLNSTMTSTSHQGRFLITGKSRSCRPVRTQRERRPVLLTARVCPVCGLIYRRVASASAVITRTTGSATVRL